MSYEEVGTADCEFELPNIVLEYSVYGVIIVLSRIPRFTVLKNLEILWGNVICVGYS